MCVNKLPSGVRSSTKFCRLNNEMLSGVGREMALEFLSCMQTTLLSASYDNTILKTKQVICLESLYLKKRTCSPSCQQDKENLSRISFSKICIPRTCNSWKGKDNAKVRFTWSATQNVPRRQFKECYGKERFHMTSRRPYWCFKTIKRRPCWCPKPILWELNSFLM